MVFRGEKIWCKECGECRTMESGHLFYISISDGGRWEEEQLALSRELMPGYNGRAKGWYYHKFGICAKCMGEKKFQYYDHVILKYVYAYAEYSNCLADLCREWERMFRYELNEEMLREIDSEAYKELEKSGLSGTKKENLPVSDRYVHKAKENIYRYAKAKSKNYTYLVKLSGKLRELAPDTVTALKNRGQNELVDYVKYNAKPERDYDMFFGYGEVTGPDMFCEVTYGYHDLYEMLTKSGEFSSDEEIRKAFFESKLFRSLPNTIAKLKHKSLHKEEPVSICVINEIEGLMKDGFNNGKGIDIDDM